MLTKIYTHTNTNMHETKLHLLFVSDVTTVPIDGIWVKNNVGYLLLNLKDEIHHRYTAF